MANPIKGVVKRARTIAREVRDIPTAIGTSLTTQQDFKGGNPKDKAALTRNANQASKNLDKQLVEAAKAILSGKSGSSSDVSNEYAKYKRGRNR
jgi:hypothetical protein